MSRGELLKVSSVLAWGSFAIPLFSGVASEKGLRFSDGASAGLFGSSHLATPPGAGVRRWVQRQMRTRDAGERQGVGFETDRSTAATDDTGVHRADLANERISRPVDRV
jgi:hypothetical protein